MHFGPSLHNWSVTQCWDLGRAPITGDDVVMNGVAGSGGAATNYDLAAGVQLHSITILKGGGTVRRVLVVCEGEYDRPSLDAGVRPRAA